MLEFTIGTLLLFSILYFHRMNRIFTWSMGLEMPEPDITKQKQSVQSVQTCLLWNQSKTLVLWLQPVLNKFKKKTNWELSRLIIIIHRIGYLGMGIIKYLCFISMDVFKMSSLYITWSKVPEKLELDITMQKLNVPFVRIYFLWNQKKMLVPLLRPVLYNK